MIGQLVSHYRILEEIGEGGMGVVYRADDTRLNRTVALKFLRDGVFDVPEQKQRFIREARLAAAIEHPNVCEVFDIGEHDNLLFISMPYIEGTTLKDEIRAGPLDIARVVDITVQLALGLMAAHDKGIVHRDIKSSNVIVTPTGRAVITDFGLATIPGDTDISDVRTAAGSTSYMSPEQVRSEPVDRRTDIWSLGVVAYEMLTGRLPFAGDFDAAVIYAILNQEPPPLTELRPDVPADFARVVTGMLAKDPRFRYEKIEHVLDVLHGTRNQVELGTAEPAAMVPTTPSIAVLPFTDMSPDKDQEYFCDGIAEEITNALAKVERLRVVARTSAFAFKNEATSVREIGRMLGVDAVVEGSVRKAGDRLRITAQLTDPKEGFDLWSERYDRDLGDIFAIQDDITLAVVDNLKVKLLGDDRATLIKRYTANPAAINAYWQGRFFWNQRTQDGYERALSYFQQAIDRDPTYALAYVGMADCYDLLGWYDYMAPEDAFPRARTAATQALDMDETVAEAHATLGWVAVNYDWRWTEAEDNYRRALELNPGYASAHQWYAEYLSYMGRHDEAFSHATEAVELDPLSIIINTDLGQVYYYARDHDRAIDQLRKTLEMAPKFSIAHFFLAFAYAARGSLELATESAMNAITHGQQKEPLHVAQLAMMHALSGRESNAIRLLDDLDNLALERYVSPFSTALVHAHLGEFDRAFERLGQAVQARDHWMETLKVHPALDPLRNDTRFDALLERMNLK